MKRHQTVWVLQRPDLAIATSMIRATCKEGINAFRDHLVADQVADAWPIAYRRGFRAVRAKLEQVDVNPDFNGG